MSEAKPGRIRTIERGTRARSSEPAGIGWVQALVLDFDGTIVDTETVEFDAWSTIWQAHGQELVLDEWLACVGTRGGFDPLVELAHRVDRALDEDELWARRSTLVEERWGLLEARPGVLAWIEEAEDKGVPVAVASSAHRRHLETRLATLGLLHRMDAVVGADDAGAAKPDPGVYRLACRRVGVDPGSSLAVEDSVNGVLAAKAAGLAVVAVPNPVTVTLDLSGADLVVDSLEDRTIARTAGRIRPGG